MYPCTNCGRVLTSQQNLNYHLSHKPNTCEKYLRKQAAMETSSSPKPSSQVAPATQTTVVSLSSAAKSTALNRTPLASPPLASPVVSRTIAPATQTAAASLSSAEKSTVLSLASLSSQKCPEPRKLLAGESAHNTMFDTDGYCWYAYTGSAKAGRYYEKCRCCAMYHASDPSNVVAHIRTSKEMKCKCALNAPCKCKKGPQPPLFVLSRCTGKRVRLTRHGVPSGERALYEERVSHDSSFCKVNKAEMVAAVNMANMKAKARTAQSCQHLKVWQVRQAMGAGAVAATEREHRRRLVQLKFYLSLFSPGEGDVDLDAARRIRAV